MATNYGYPQQPMPGLADMQGIPAMGGYPQQQFAPGQVALPPQQYVDAQYPGVPPEAGVMPAIPAEQLQQQGYQNPPAPMIPVPQTAPPIPQTAPQMPPVPVAPAVPGVEVPQQPQQTAPSIDAKTLAGQIAAGQHDHQLDALAADTRKTITKAIESRRSVLSGGPALTPVGANSSDSEVVVYVPIPVSKLGHVLQVLES